MTIPEEKQQYADAIRQLIPVNELPAEVQNEIIKNAELIELKKKSQIFNQGDRDGYSFYLIEGEIDLVANGQVSSSIKAATDRAKYPMAQLQPRQFSGVAKEKSVVMRIDRNSLDKLLVVHQGEGAASDEFGDGLGESSSVVEVDVIDGDEEESVDWMSRMLQSEIFASMPTSNMHQLFALLEPIEYKKGDNIITQGETGEHYYIIQEGKCEVLRQTKPGAKELKLAELSAGDGFGEEALITETVRNATIRMKTDGLVAQLSKDNFVSLIQKTTLKAVSTSKAEEIIGGGGKWLDVRFKNEHDRSNIEDSLHIPLNILRMQADKLAPDIHYVLYCDTGGRSSTGAFLLTDRGFSASYLDGGLMNHPELAPEDEVTQVPTPPPADPAPAKPSTEDKKPATDVTPAAKPEKQEVKEPPPAAEKADEEMDPEIMATVLDTELTRTNMEIERAKKSDQTVIRNQETAKKLEEEKNRLKAERAKVESDIKKLRQQEEVRLKKLQQEAESRMQDEKKKLEDVYAKNAEEMEKLEQLKAEAEENLKAEKERLEKDAEEARKNKQDAEKIKQELEVAKKAMEEAAAKQQLAQEEMRKKIEMEARKKIEMERRKLADQVAKNNAEIEQARKEKAIAEAARAAAKEEAELMIKEMQTKQDQSMEEQEKRIKEERLKLEAEQKKIQAAMQDIHKAKAEAEALKRAALAEVTALKAKQAQEDVTSSEAIKEQMQTKIKSAQEKLAKASEKATEAEKEEEKVVVAQKVNQEDLVKKKAEEEVLAKQLQADLADFKEELDEAEREYASATTQLEHMKRIRERAIAAKQEAEQANDDLLSDISSQLTTKK